MLGAGKSEQAQMLLEELMRLFSELPDEDGAEPESEAKLEIAVEAEPKKEII